MSNRLAKTLRVVNERGSLRLEIDGEEFPYYTKDGYHLHVSRTGGAGVTLTIVAENVEVIDTAMAPYDGERGEYDQVVDSRVDDSPFPTHVVALPPNRSALND